MNNKKGLSDVVSNVLIILIVVAAVAILGLIVINLVKSAGGGVTAQAMCQTLDVSVQSCTKFNASGINATASVIRGSGDPDVIINKVELSFTPVGSTTTVKGTVDLTAPATTGDGKLTIGETVSGTGIGDLAKVIPIVYGVDADGKEFTCALTQKEAACN